MHDEVAVGVVHRPCDFDEQLEPLSDGQAPPVCVPRQRLPLDPLHDEVRPPALGNAAIEDLRQVRVRQRR